MAKKALRSVYLDLEQVERLKILSDKTRVPQAVYIREGLDLVMSKHEKRLKKSRTAGKPKRTESRSLKLLKR